MDDMTQPDAQPKGYVLGEGRRFEDVLAIEADLLRSEGVDPEWPGFGSTAESDRRTKADRRKKSK